MYAYLVSIYVNICAKYLSTLNPPPNPPVESKLHSCLQERKKNNETIWYSLCLHNYSQSEPEGFSVFHLYVCAALLKKYSDKILTEKDFQVRNFVNMLVRMVGLKLLKILVTISGAVSSASFIIAW